MGLIRDEEYKLSIKSKFNIYENNLLSILEPKNEFPRLKESDIKHLTQHLESYGIKINPLSSLKLCAHQNIPIKFTPPNKDDFNGVYYETEDNSLHINIQNYIKDRNGRFIYDSRRVNEDANFSKSIEGGIEVKIDYEGVDNNMALKTTKWLKDFFINHYNIKK